MTDKEAIENIIDTSLKEKSRGVCTLSIEYLKSIKEYIQTQQEEIETQRDIIVRHIKKKVNLEAELEKKEKIIEEMATYIGKIDTSEELCNDDICHEGNNCNKCIIEYFTNKVEKENNNMPKLIRNWKELSQVPPNEKYKIVVDEDMCNGWIKPIKETEETKEDYFKHHKYLSTHTFYGSNYEFSTKLLQQYGFDIELENWDKENKDGNGM